MAKPAQPPPPVKLRINLLYPQGLPQKFTVKLAHWILSYGRVILIFVELIVLATFGFRFALDDRLETLKEDISARVPYIQSLAEDEALIRQTQFKLATIRKTLEFTPNVQKLSDKIALLTPVGVRFTSLNIENPQPNTLQFRIVGRATTNSDLGIFLNNLKTDANLKNVDITSIGLDEGAVVFTITGGYNLESKI